MNWHATLEVLDLTDPDAGWMSIDQPFERRALCAAAFQNRIYLIGGLTSDDEMTGRVDVFSPQTGWQAGPPVPGDVLNGFGASACVHRGQLLLSSYDGRVYRLSENGREWHNIGGLAVPRYMHQMVSCGSELLAVGGESASGHTRLTERVNLPCGPGENDCGTAITTWRFPNSSEIRSSPSACLFQGDIIAFGGSNRDQTAGLADDCFESAAFRISLSAAVSQRLQDASEERMLMNAVVVDDEDDPLVLSFGGVSAKSAPFDRLDLMCYQIRQGQWLATQVEIPQRRWLFQTARDDAGIWLFGGLSRAPETDDFESPHSVLRFDPSAEHLFFRETTCKLPTPRFSFAAAQEGDRVYLVGGFQSQDRFSETCDVFDLATQEWTSLAPLPCPRVRGSLTSLNGRLYLAGGKSPDDSGNLTADHSVLEYDPKSQLWNVLVDQLPVSTSSVHLFSLPHQLLAFTVEPRHNYDFQLCTISP